MLLSLVDYVLTWWLLQPESSPVYEANPVADWWLQRTGWAGLALYKVAAVLLAVIAVQALFWYRPLVASRLLFAACLITGATVGYSAGLALTSPERNQKAAEIARLKNEQAAIRQESRRATAYREVLEQASQDLLTGRRTVAEAVAELAGTDKGQDPAWLTLLRRRYAGLSDLECLASNVCDYTLVAARDRQPEERAELRQRLRREFRQFLEDRSSSTGRKIALFQGT